MNKNDYITNVEKYCQDNGLRFISKKELENIPIPKGLDCPFRLPEAKGMRVHGIITDLPLDHLKKEEDGTWYYNNPMRGDDSNKESQGHIVQLKKIINEDNWRPEAHINPTVKFEFEVVNGFHTIEIILVTGNHTALAHYGCDKEVMYVVVVEFFEQRNLPAIHWEENWQSIENKDSDDYAKLVRTEQEIQNRVQKWIDIGRIEKDEDHITQALKDQECTETEIKKIRNDLLEDNNLTDKHVRPIDAKTLEQKEKIYKDNHPDEVVISQGYDSEKDTKYEAEVSRKLKIEYIKNPKKFKKPAKVVSKVKVETKTKVIKIRKSKSKEGNFVEADLKLNIKFLQTRLENPDCPFEVEHLWVKQLSEDKEDFIIIK